MGQTPNEDSLEVVLQLALHEEQSLADRANWLDTKTGAVLGFVIVSISELLGFLLLASVEPSRVAISKPCSVAILFTGGLIALLIAMILGLAELAPMGFTFGASTEYLAGRVDQQAADIRSECITSMKSASVHNRGIVQRKAKLLRSTAVFVGAALLCQAIAVAILFFSLLK